MSDAEPGEVQQVHPPTSNVNADDGQPPPTLETATFETTGGGAENAGGTSYGRGQPSVQSHLVLPTRAFSENPGEEVNVPVNVGKYVDDFVVPEGFQRDGSRDQGFIYWGVYVKPTSRRSQKKPEYFCMASQKCQRLKKKGALYCVREQRQQAFQIRAQLCRRNERHADSEYRALGRSSHECRRERQDVRHREEEVRAVRETFTEKKTYNSSIAFAGATCVCQDTAYS